MKENIRRLKAIGRIVDLDLFYNVELTKYYIRLQGTYNVDVSEKLLKNKFEINTDRKDGYFALRRNNIYVVFTPA